MFFIFEKKKSQRCIAFSMFLNFSQILGSCSCKMVLMSKEAILYQKYSDQTYPFQR